VSTPAVNHHAGRAVPVHEYPAVIVGAGGAGLWAALEQCRAPIRLKPSSKSYLAWP
jgi:succinate dehydrogenase/fumarate reductase flavoprotein subunit